MPSHRSGRLKQSNKKHKTPGGTRPSNEHALAGRVQRKSSKTNNTAQQGKQDRLNRHKQLMQEKRLQTIRTKRQTQSSQSTYIAVLPLSSDIRFQRLATTLVSNGDEWSWMENTDQEQPNRSSLRSKTQKTNFTFFTPGIAEYQFDPLGLIEAIGACHSVLLLVDFEDDMVHPLVDNLGTQIIQLLLAYGFPGVTLGYFSTAGKFNLKNPPKIWRNELEKLSQTLSIFGDLKYLDLRDRNLSRHLVENNKPVKWRQQRSYLITQNLVIEEDEEEQEGHDEGSSSGQCKIILQGLLNGCPLNVNSLVHIAGVGVGRIARITKIEKNHHSTSSNTMTADDDDDNNQQQYVEADPDKQDDFDLEAEGDVLQGEQTWPHESEYENAEDMEEDEEDEEEDGDIAEGLDQEEGAKNVMDFFNRKQVPGTKQQQRKDEEQQQEEDGAMEEANDDDEDEEERGDFVDSPFDISARQRFARYRALQSFRQSPWHPKENLPAHYSRIFQFEDLKGMQKRTTNLAEDLIKKQCESFLAASGKGKNGRSRTTSHEGPAEGDEGEMEIEGGSASNRIDDFLLEGTDDYVRTDQFIQIEIDCVNKEKVQQQFQKDGYLVVYSLHSHEYKLSILHFNIKRVHGSTESVRSKDRLLFVHGFRSYWTKPIFSESNLNSDKHKFQRYLPLDGFSMVSCIGPVTMTPQCPLLIFKQSEVDGSLSLLATGNLASIDPDRIMLKKIILTGNPIRVRKRTGVIKHMFYDPLDVRYFKPAELVTKHGLRGHIKESVGIHGLFKAFFSGMIKQNDKVWLILYKRVFPKFPEEGVEIL